MNATAGSMNDQIYKYEKGPKWFHYMDVHLCHMVGLF